MEDVTDTVFRQIIAKCGKPDIFFTEFTNVEGLCSRGREKVIKRLKFTDVERPIVAQIWGITPSKFFEAAKLIKQMGFNGIDINMGCPQKRVIKKGACGGLINNPSLVREIILATQKGADGLPVSVKTRIGINKIQTEEWIGFLLGLELDALTIHGRIVAEMSEGLPHWDEIEKAVKLKEKMKVKTLIIGNGNIKSREDALDKCEKYRLDGVMIGRGIFDNLWIFNKDINSENISYREKLKLLIKHVTLFDKTWGKTKNFSIMKKFYKIYISGIPDASMVRSKLMEFKTASETLKFFKSL